MSLLSIIALMLSMLVALLFIVGRLRQERVRPAPRGGANLLFDDEELVDASGLAEIDPGLADTAKAGRSALIMALAPRFPDLKTWLATEDAELVTLRPASGNDLLVVERKGSLTRFSINDELDTRMGARIISLEHELDLLRHIVHESPHPSWQEDESGRVIWANRAYLDLADRVRPQPEGEVPVWPIHPIFSTTDAPGSEMRIALTLPEKADPLWFDIHRSERNGQVTGFAADASRIVAAETARSTFVQMLSRTFADLRTGLAVFDHRRRLVMFNPAFLDLTGLKSTYLARQPHVRTILDRLREAQILPEPRNWSSWRDHIASLQTQAEEGVYCENWSLPGQRTYRITGHPHPDGALAFFLEDISDDISLNRHLRLEQEAVQEILDMIPQAVAAFSQGGSLILYNRAYADLWDVPADRTVSLDLMHELERWRRQSTPTPLWERIPRTDDAEKLTDLAGESITLADGRNLKLDINPLGAGRIAVSFEETARMDPQEPGSEARIRMLV